MTLSERIARLRELTDFDQLEHLPHLGAISQIVEAMPEALAVVTALEDELAERDASFELRWKAHRRATEKWQKATGKKLVWPDHADLCVYLSEQLTALEAENAALKEELRANGIEIKATPEEA